MKERTPSCGYKLLGSNFHKSQTYTIIWTLFEWEFRYLVKTYMDRSGGKSVSYLVGSNLAGNKVVDMSLESIVILYEKAAAG